MQTLLCLLWLSLPGFSQVSYAIDSLGLTTLTYNGAEYLDPTFRTINPPFITFQRPDLTTYDADRTGRVNTSDATSNTSTYALGQFRTKVVYSQPDANSIKLAVTLYNDNATDTILPPTFGLWPIGLAIPNPHTVVATTHDAGFVNGYGVAGIDTIVDFGSSTRLAIFTDNASDYWYSAAYYTPGVATDRWDIIEQNFQTSGQYPSGIYQTYQTSIAPLASKTINVYLRFGATSSTREALEPELFTGWQAAYPLNLIWPDRRPIISWFLAEPTRTSATNPRGWLADATCNCIDQATFNTRMTAQIDFLLGIAATYPFTPQGIIVWDIEGAEISPMVYMGSPNYLSWLAPEMESYADGLFARLRTAGYRVGVTIRPQNILHGTSVPGSCTYSADYSYNSSFVLENGTPLARVYTCQANGTYTQVAGGQMYWTTVATVATEIITKATYARNRWGATLFYVDTTTWANAAGYPAEVWRLVRAALPDSQFFPEQKTNLSYGSISGYIDAVSSGLYNSTLLKFPYDHAFSMLRNGVTDVAHASEVIQGIRWGDVYAINAGLSQAVDLKARMDVAQALNSVMPVTNSATGRVTHFSSNPGAAYTFPLVMRVYFASSSGGLPASTTYCEQRGVSGCTLNLAGMTHYNIRYLTFTGTQVSVGAATPLP